MTKEALEVYRVALSSMTDILSGLNDWATTMLDGNERDEALFHINRLAVEWDELTLAIADHNRVPLA